MGFFLLLLTTCLFMWVPAAWPHLTTSQHILVPFTSFLVYMTFFQAAFTDPGTVTRENYRHALQIYPYDNILFHPGIKCTTCNFTKPARSKHCRTCKSCVARHDHHCVWINNCVGQGNNHYFILFLSSISLMLTYGTNVTYSLLSQLLQDRQQSIVRFSNQQHFRPESGIPHWSTGLNWSNYFALWGWAIIADVFIGGVGLLCALCMPMAWGFLGYHIYLIWAGMTTNESLKWADWKDDIADGLVFMAEGETGDASPITTGQAGTDIEPPVPRKRTLTRTVNGEPPGYSQPGSKHSHLGLKGGGVPKWRRVKSLKEVENTYDGGFWKNVGGVFKPVIL
ncbi:MAG: palmitoyltransferase swf1 [Geoglossum umbratile]|nr:MAG: palmitoyltransferase swf1 [Geoglossum umbratile]